MLFSTDSHRTALAASSERFIYFLFIFFFVFFITLAKSRVTFANDASEFSANVGKCI